ncbi:hypothetical protein HPB47_016950 [Ixodes persulcatus]|uniref:Uncharacterized protein n=1 Tax=Ixodes persulcatus TaxID=34615 RepID=A0AC60QPL1_IXOPE|nr:hypothetical protein HPB47_016950 [Ixodes persulcatus]
MRHPLLRRLSPDERKAYGSLADLAAALGHPYEGGGPQQSTQATPGIEMTDLPENQLLSETPFSEEGTGQLQNTPLLMQVNLPYHQVLSTPEVSHLFQVLAGVIERQPAFLEALQQLVARFTPQPQEIVDNPNRPTPHKTSRRGDEEPTQRTQEMQDGGHLTPVRLTEQDGDRPPQTSAPPLNEGIFQGHPLKRTKPPAPPNLLPASETNDDKEWPLLGIFSLEKKIELTAYEKCRRIYTEVVPQKLLKIKAIRQGEDTNALQPYKALAGNQCRGVVYLRGQNNEVTPEQLQEDIECRTHKLVAARPLGTKGNTILVTFEGRTRPQRVSYMHEVLPVREYRPRPLVCFKCHAIGHKKDVCPREKERCGTCGSEHDGMEKCSQIPKCANCGWAHVATSNECPKRAIPPRRPAKKTGENSAQGIDKPILPPPAGRPAGQDAGTSYAAVTMGAFQPTVSPEYPAQRLDTATQVLQLQYAGFARMEKQLAELTTAIHRLIDTRNDRQ